MSEFEQEPEDEDAPDTVDAEEEPQKEAPSADGNAHFGPGEADFSALEEEAEEDAEGEERVGPGLAGTITLADHDLRGALEALILVSDKPVAAMRLARMTRQDLGVVKRALAELCEAYKGRGIVLDEIAGGFQFRTSPRYAPFVRNLVDQKPTKLSRSQLEVLAIIAYRQPVTRPEIEDVRGVDSGHSLKVLLERSVIRILGKKDEAGRPLLYGTTTEFLELFGLKSLRDMPTLKEFAELTPESRDIFERRIGEPLPGHGQGMDLETHYSAPPEEDAAEEGETDGNVASDGDATPTAEDSVEAATDDDQGPADAEYAEADEDSDAAGSTDDEEIPLIEGEFDDEPEDAEPPAGEKA